MKKRKIGYIVILFIAVSVISNTALVSSIQLKCDDIATVFLNKNKDRHAFNPLGGHSLVTKNNLIRNPSFEIPSTGWLTFNLYSFPAKFIWDNRYAHSGKYSVGIRSIKAQNHMYGWIPSLRNLPAEILDSKRHDTDLYGWFPVYPRYHYVTSMWFKFVHISQKANGKFVVGFSLVFYKEKAKPISSYTSVVEEHRDTKWHYHEVDISSVMPRGTNFVYIMIYCEYRSNDPHSDIPDVEVRFDDVYLGTKETISNFRPNTPILEGKRLHPNKEKSYTVKIKIKDPDKSDKLFLYIYWGETFSDEWYGPFKNGVEIELSHTFVKRGMKEIKALVIDSKGGVSDWSKLNILVMQSKDKGTAKRIKFQRNALNIPSPTNILHNILPILSHHKFVIT